MTTPLERMQRLVGEAHDLDAREVGGWHERARLAVAAAYGDPSSNLERFDGVWYSPGVYTADTPQHVFDEAALDGVREALGMLRAFIEDLSSPGVAIESQQSRTAPRKASEPRAVMVIHGHDTEATRAMFDWLRAVDLQPLEWGQLVQYTDDASPFIGQVLDAAFARAQAVVALLTPDERVATREELSNRATQWRLQARPNVLFEAGMAFATHPRQTVLVVLGDQELPSDVAGRHFIRLNSVAALKELAQRLETAGCGVDTSGSDWLDFDRFPLRDNTEPAPALSSQVQHDLRAAAARLLSAHAALLQAFSGERIYSKDVKLARAQLDEAVANVVVASPEPIGDAAEELRRAWHPRGSDLFMGSGDWRAEVEDARARFLAAVRTTD